jgi:hypothetical protein
MALPEYTPQTYWQFSRNGHREETSSTIIPEGKEAKLALLAEAIKSGWPYIDQGYGFECVEDVVAQIKRNY